MSDIKQLCAIFYANPDKSYIPSDFKEKEGWNYNSVRKQFRRLLKYRIIRQLSTQRYILADSKTAIDFINPKSDTLRPPSLTPPHRIRTKAHDLSVGEIDLSGEPLEWMLKLNMLTKPNPRDPAKNVGLREGQAKMFNMRISLRTGKAHIYPKIEGWERELLDIFSWCGDFINRLNDVNENVGIAINFDDLKRLRPDYENIRFEDIKGLVLEHEGMKIQLCASQFKEGEVCIHTDSIESTMSLADKITYGNRDLSQALKETAFEKQIFKRLGGIERSMNSLVSLMAESLPKAIQEGVEKGIERAFNKMPQSKPDDDDPMVR